MTLLQRLTHNETSKNIDEVGIITIDGAHVAKIASAEATSVKTDYMDDTSKCLLICSVLAVSKRTPRDHETVAGLCALLNSIHGREDASIQNQTDDI